MEILEFGNEEKEKIILIHGFQSPYQVWDDYIKYYEKNYHIIVPILQGHNIKVKDNFSSFKDCVKEIEDYYISRYGYDVYAIFGMSMGGIIAANIWQSNRLNIKNIIFDGSPLVSYPKIMKSYFVNFYLNVTHKSQQRDKKTIEQAINSIISEDKLEEFLQVLDNMSDITIKNYLNEWANYKLPKDIDKTKTKVYYYHGTKLNEILAKKTARYLKKYYPINSKIICFKGKSHCEVSLMRPKEMIKELDKILK